MEFGILGPLEARDRGRQIQLGAAKQRSLLGVLLLHANEAVSSERLVDEVWGARLPARPHKLVQGYISALRKLLGADRILTQRPGYIVRVESGELDLHQFELLTTQARREPPDVAADLLREALRLWRGRALGDLPLEGFAAREAERLNELRLTALLERVEADLRLGRDAELIGELETLVDEHPLQERPRGLLMLALYRAGRQAEALELYRETRTLLADELGLEPGEELRLLHRRILTHDPELDLQRPKEPARPPLPAPTKTAARVRRSVSAVFVDLVGSTTLAEQLDPESLHGVLARYSETCADVLERHGGTVEEFLGDAVVAVFGLPTLHEDDALRAVRAAVELRRAAADLSGELETDWGVRVDVKIAVNSGEVFAGAGGRREAFASGDALDVAARVKQSAGAGEILLGEQTYHLVHQVVEAEPLPPLAIKGRVGKVRTWRLTRLLPDEPPRPEASPFVGRIRELNALVEEVVRASAESTCRLCTVVGPPGIGKSRLARELIASVGRDGTVVEGRCISYGEGVTYRPLAEIVRGIGGDDPQAGIVELLAGDERAGLIADLVLGAAGLADTKGQTEDIAWAFRRLLETLARDRPLLAVLEDVHWAEPTILDLLDYLASFSTDVPILLLCLTRPELLEQRPAWSTPQPNRTMLVLDPLPEGDANDLVDHVAGEELGAHARTQIVRTAEGNPLFLEQLVAVQREGKRPILPPSVHAVLSARIDRLEPGERTVLERAAAEGRTFHRGALALLLPESDRPTLTARLMTLVAKQLIRPDRPEFAGEDAFRFGHVLVLQAAYAGVPKTLRAELHETIAAWLEGKSEAQDEIVGYHLSEAYRYRSQLGPVDEHARTLARRAGKRLGAAGRRALARWDLSAAVGLLDRATELLEPDEADRLPLLVDLGEALQHAFQLPRAEAVLQEALQQARTAGDERLEAHALLSLHGIRSRMDPSGTDPRLDEAGVQRAIRTFEEHRDERGLAEAWSAASHLRFMRLRERDGVAALRRALEHAERANDTQFQALTRISLALALDATSAHLVEVRAVQEDNLAWAEAMGSQRVRAASLALAARLAAREGRFEEARSLIEEARTLFGALGVETAVTRVADWTGEIAELADDLEAAERAYREGLERADRAGARALHALLAYRLGRVIDAREDHDDVGGLLVVPTEEAGQTALGQVFWRSARARELARGGQIEEAVGLAREAVALAEGSDDLRFRCERLEDLVQVLDAAGSPGEAIPAVEELLRLRERKGETVAASRARSLLEQLRATAVA
jgi:class 3 adenylate cyclase/DNA-binding winged helix-turn-helix (wHTH) protein